MSTSQFSYKDMIHVDNIYMTQLHESKLCTYAWSGSFLNTSYHESMCLTLVMCPTKHYIQVPRLTEPKVTWVIT